jgi:hypothetical protein
MNSLPHLLGPMLFTFAASAAVVGIVSGFWLLIAPGGFARIEAMAGGPFSLRRGLRPFDISRNVDRYFYRHHEAIGLLAIAASTFTLYRTMFDIVPGKVARILINQYPAVVAEWLIASLQYTLLLGNLFAIVVGLVIYVRPSALKDFEARANRWFTARKKTLWLQSRLGNTSEILSNQPRTLGIIILVLSTYLISMISIG